MILSVTESKKDSCIKGQLTRTKARQRKSFLKRKDKCGPMKSWKVPLTYHTLPKMIIKDSTCSTSSLQQSEMISPFKKTLQLPQDSEKRELLFINPWHILKSIRFYSFSHTSVLVFAEIILVLRCFLILPWKRLECWVTFVMKKAIIVFDLEICLWLLTVNTLILIKFVTCEYSFLFLRGDWESFALRVYVL